MSEYMTKSYELSDSLLIASQCWDTQTTEELLLGGAEVNAQNQNGNAVLFQAVNKGDIGVVKAVLSGGAKVNARTKNGWTALLLAEDKGHAKIVRMLKQAGAR